MLQCFNASAADQSYDSATNTVVAIRASRKNAWNVVKTRRHKLNRAYVFDSDATDILVMGTLLQGLANGQSLSSEWVARICFQQMPGESLKIRSHQVWAVCCNGARFPSYIHMANTRDISPGFRRWTKSHARSVESRMRVVHG